MLADMSRRVCSSSSERTGAGKTRFFACDARVVENCLVAFLAGDARSILEAREMDFMMGDLVIAGYGKIRMVITMCTSRNMVTGIRSAGDVGTRSINAFPGPGLA